MSRHLPAPADGAISLPARFLPRACVAIAMLALAVRSPGGPGAAKAPAVTDGALAALVERELAALAAATADALVPGAPARRLVAAGSFALPYSDGRARIVLVGLAPGAPGNLRVPTQMESLRFTVGVEDGGDLRVAERPARADLATAVARVVADEARAMAAAEAAFAAARVPLPPGHASWRDALRSITYDARLPRERFAGEPGWHLIFEDWNEGRGGWNGVLLDGGLGVVSVNGRRP